MLGMLAQTTYPNKPIRLVVPYPPGGPLDTAARALADRSKEALGVIVVENRPGAGGNLGVDQVAKSPPDGYSLVIGAVATHAVNPWLFSKLPYDPIKDFAPITLIAHVPNVLVMTPERADQLGIRSARDLIDYARKNPGRLNYASGGNGSAGHMAGELMKSQAKNLGAAHSVRGCGAGAARLAGGSDRFHVRQSGVGNRADQSRQAARTRGHHFAACELDARRPDNGGRRACRASTSPPGSACSHQPARQRRSSHV